MKFAIVTRFSVDIKRRPARGYLRKDYKSLHNDPKWLSRRFELLFSYWVPSIEALREETEADAFLLTSPDTRDIVHNEVSHLSWANVAESDAWFNGISFDEDTITTRVDSDDAIRTNWLSSLSFNGNEAAGCRQFYCLDERSSRLFLRKMGGKRPAPTISFVGGRNPFFAEHSKVDQHLSFKTYEEPNIVQICHGGNLMNDVRYSRTGVVDERFTEVDPSIVDRYGI